MYLYNYNGRLIELVYTLLIFYTRLNSGEGVKTNEKDKQADKNGKTDECNRMFCNRMQFNIINHNSTGFHIR